MRPTADSRRLSWSSPVRGVTSSAVYQDGQRIAVTDETSYRVTASADASSDLASGSGQRWWAAAARIMITTATLTSTDVLGVRRSLTRTRMRLLLRHNRTRHGSKPNAMSSIRAFIRPSIRGLGYARASSSRQVVDGNSG
ncbi:MAG TPA: hypothetical protein VGD53_10380 [Actinoallomurus sp.]|jgi:hypothetical protein